MKSINKKIDLKNIESLKKQIEILEHTSLTENEQKDLVKLNEEVQNLTAAEYLLRTGHAKPVTRREFLASGMISATGTMLLPSALTMLTNAGLAQAKESYVCPTGTDASVAKKPGLFSIHLSGGGGLKGMFVGTDKAGGLVSGNKMNLGNVPNVTQRFGANFASDHPFTAAFQTELALSGITDEQIRIAPVIATTGNDSSSDKLGVQFMASLAGIQGEILPVLGFGSNLNAGTAAPYLTPAGQVPPKALAVGV